MAERRRETRKKLVAFTPVYTAPNHKVLGYLYNLTLQGAMVVSHSPLELNHQETLLIEFPAEFGISAASQMSVAARVARCNVDEDDAQGYLLGFEFEALTPENQAIIQAFLERYHFRYQPTRSDQ